MLLTRRGFLAGAGAGVLCRPDASLASQQPVSLVAAPHAVQLAPQDYAETNVWAYGQSIPGPVLRYKQGDELFVRLDNKLPEATTVHWHGLRLPNLMDGVPGMTQSVVLPGESFEYQFALRDAGTFWYHPHANSQEQISRGLSGVLIVDEPDAPDVDDDITVVLDDWRLDEDAQVHASFGNRHDMSHAGRLGNYVTVNGVPELTKRQQRGSRVRLRLVNVATARIFELRLMGMRGWVMALDGMPLSAPQPVETLVLAPAQRADVFVDLVSDDNEPSVIGSVERDGTYAAVSFDLGEDRVPYRPQPPAALSPNEMPQVRLDDARSIALVMEGGAMRGLPQTVIWNGETIGANSAVDAGQFWVFNGVAGTPEEPLIEASAGETLRIPITNRTAFPHAMHLHGMHFREVLDTGELGPWRDTLLVQRDETREIAFVAETPGNWMFHCHMAAHQMSGMMSWIRVV